jgi:predicted transcriptional regulator
MAVALNTEAVSETMSDKERVLLMLQDMRDSVTLNEIRQELYVLAQVDQALKEADAGDFVTHEEAGKLLAKWLQG